MFSKLRPPQDDNERQSHRNSAEHCLETELPWWINQAIKSYMSQEGRLPPNTVDLHGFSTLIAVRVAQLHINAFLSRKPPEVRCWECIKILLRLLLVSFF